MIDLQQFVTDIQSKIDQWEDDPDMVEAVAAWRYALANMLEALNEQS
jgi:hypothetical protein